MSDNIPTLGADQQVKTKRWDNKGHKIADIFSIIIIGFTVLFFVVQTSGKDSSESTKSPVEEHIIEAEIDCKPLIERHAKYSVKWTDGLLGGIFSKAGQNGNVISYYGDKVQLQNGFGAYATYSYKCNYNTVTGTTDLVALEKGRL